MEKYVEKEERRGGGIEEKLVDGYTKNNKRTKKDVNKEEN